MLILAGSTPTSRDGNSIMFLGNNDSLKKVTDKVAWNSIVSIRYDIRGVEVSKIFGILITNV